VAKASQQPTRNRVYFKIVLAELAATGKFSDEASLRRIVRCCAEERIRWGADAPPEPPPLFWKGSVENFTFNGSDVTNAAAAVVMRDGIGDLVAFTLEGVWLDWDDVRANVCPELGEVPTPGGLAAAVREILALLPATLGSLWKGKRGATAVLKPKANEWFYTEVKNDPIRPDEGISEYASRLHKRMQEETRDPWEESTVRTRAQELFGGVNRKRNPAA
jgi:hypothetical protein